MNRVTLALSLALAGLPFLAQGESESASPASGPRLPGLPISGTNDLRAIPALPGMKTAADTVRELLAMSPVERAQELAKRTEYQRKHLEKSLLEYEALPPAIREKRLVQLELKCYLPGLMELDPTNRVLKLGMVPPRLRPLIDERLRQWDKLPTQAQKEILRYQTTSSYFMQARPEPPPLPESAGGSSEERGRKLLVSFFELSPGEQEKTLQALPPAERVDMQKTIQGLEKLPLEQRQDCIESFEKFRLMTKEQRERFLQSAERWKAMSPGEREAWRTLVKILPPGTGVLSPPPLPPANSSTGAGGSQVPAGALRGGTTIGEH